ncbi:uncharacterized protein LOC143460187 isoform X2 [Clavelina lepadiformis]|uniref:uncharacterized protein LOC143460187 isoform X2 n=1 Tax=Clavelina lepadiformis TaxID=159417 RepID=UPI004042C7BE
MYLISIQCLFRLFRFIIYPLAICDVIISTMNTWGGNTSEMSSATSNPATAHMRVFVGNLNTMSITKPTLQNIFGKYGNISAISMHRGFAFVQYSNAYSARSAVQGENGSVIAGQTIDINIATEPKPNQKPVTQQGGFNSSGGQNFGSSGFETPQNGGLCLRFGAAKRGRGARGGLIARGVAATARGMLGRGARGARGRGMGRGRGAGAGAIPNKVQAGRVEKPTKAKLSNSTKPMLPPLTKRAELPLHSPVITPPTAISGTIVATTAEDGSQSIDLNSFKTQLIEIRDKINTLLEHFPAQLILDKNDPVVQDEQVAEEVIVEDSMETDVVVKKEA